MKETTVRSENDGSTVVFFVRYAAKRISCFYEDAIYSRAAAGVLLDHSE